MKNKRIGVLLSGCGFLDGSEIQEATLTLLALDRRGVQVVPVAPSIEQSGVINHVSPGGSPASGSAAASAPSSTPP